jgi:hypothetical protein
LARKKTHKRESLSVRWGHPIKPKRRGLGLKNFLTPDGIVEYKRLTGITL